MAKYLDLHGLTYYNNKEKQRTENTYVKKVTGKDLSSNDFTNADKQKLDQLDVSNLVTIGTAQTITETKKFETDKPAAAVFKAKTNGVNKGVIDFERYDGQTTGKIGLIDGNIDQFTVQALRGDLKLLAANNIDIKSKKIVNVAMPTDATDVANKQYVDNQISPINTKNQQQDTKITANENAIAAVKAKVDSLNSVVQLKGRVDAVANLPTANNQNGDLYLVGAQGSASFAEYIWDGTKWEKLGDTSGQITSYNALTNKPQISGVELTGNKTAADLNLLSVTDVIAISNAEIDALF